MKRLHVTFWLVLTLACGGPVEPEQTPEPAEAAPAQLSVLQLSAEAIQRAGVSTEQVRLITAPSVLTLPGQVALNEDRTVTAGSFVEGIVADCCTPVGAYVRSGEILAELHSHQTHELLGEYRKARAALEARQSERIYAQQAQERALRLRELKAGSDRDVQQAQTALAVAATAVEAAEADLDSSIAHFEYLGVDTEAIRQGETPDHLRVVVRAPVDGVVVERTVAQGDVVSPSDSLYRISDLSQIWVVARASEQQLPMLSPGMAASFRVRAFSDRGFAGRVLRVSDELDVDTKTVQVIVSIANPGRSLKTGMYGDVELTSAAEQQIIAVSEGAVQLIDEQETVFVVSGEGSFRPRAVTVGRSFAGNEEILEGLEPDETIVVQGAFALKSELLKARFAEEE